MKNDPKIERIYAQIERLRRLGKLPGQERPNVGEDHLVSERCRMTTQANDAVRDLFEMGFTWGTLPRLSCGLTELAQARRLNGGG